MKIISSSFTFFYKYVFSSLWFLSGPITLLVFIVKNNQMDLLFYLWPILWFVFSIILCFTAVQLKQIKVLNDQLYISNYIRTIDVAISEIDSILEHRYFNPEHVTLIFKSPTEFGEKIIFMPSIRLFKKKEHPAVNLLKGIMKIQP